MEVTYQAPDERTWEKMLHSVAEHRRERDLAVGAVLLMAFDGVISQSRAAELLGMSLEQIRAEAKRLVTS